MSRPEQIESSPKLTTRITDNDVLLGRGSGPNENVGNCMFRAEIEKHQPAYKNNFTNDKKRKMAIEAAIIRIIHSKGGRFLKKVQKGTSSTAKKETLFEVVSDPKILHYKVKQAFRYKNERSAGSPKRPGGSEGGIPAEISSQNGGIGASATEARDSSLSISSLSPAIENKAVPRLPDVHPCSPLNPQTHHPGTTRAPGAVRRSSNLSLPIGLEEATLRSYQGPRDDVTWRGTELGTARVLAGAMSPGRLTSMNIPSTSGSTISEREVQDLILSTSCPPLGWGIPYGSAAGLMSNPLHDMAALRAVSSNNRIRSALLHNVTTELQQRKDLLLLVGGYNLSSLATMRSAIHQGNNTRPVADEEILARAWQILAKRNSSNAQLQEELLSRTSPPGVPLPPNDRGGTRNPQPHK